MGSRNDGRNLAAGPDFAGPPSRPQTPIMATSSSSKVTVEYHDPSGIFPLVEPQLTSRLPLRNLHWKSPSRPLRSIDSLHIDLVASRDPTEEFLRPQLSRPPSSAGARQRATSSASTRPTSTDSYRPTTSRRRHQIPGLSQTPYLKVLLLRCDDNETYKSNSRRLLREWIRENTPSHDSNTSKSKQENHDAFEWLILHVVLPDTPAATQPRWSGSSSSSTGSIDKPSSSSRWPGRGSSTIFEKIRSDFNVVSKSDPDRVAQIRLQKSDIPAHLMPPGLTAPPASHTESPQDILNAWGDAISKFKTLILLSFDLRVTQYEEDIKEKDSQRSLPGWNFCTFFVLKEGLARGFESVGLVEDALVGYDELSVGLDSIIREEAAGGMTGTGSAFLDYSEDLKQHFIASRQSSTEAYAESYTKELFAKPISSSRKDYRGLILSSNISIFDFRCYIFARQMVLLLRLGNAHIARSEFLTKPASRPSTATQAKRSTDDLSVGLKTGQFDEQTEDLTSLAELCRRAMSFMTIVARILRRDLEQGLGEDIKTYPQSMIDNFVSSWTYAVAQQVLDATVTSTLPVATFEKPLGTATSAKTPAGGRKHELKVNVPDQKNKGSLPQRGSSLLDRRASVQEPPYARSSGQVVYEHGKSNSASQMVQKDPAQSSTSLKNGQLELAAHRAELYLVQRRIVERIGKNLYWLVGWASVAAQHGKDNNFTEISLDDDAKPSANGEENGEEVSKGDLTAGVGEATLRAAFATFEDFRNLYEQLSDQAVKYYFAANRSKAAESILGDLAALKFEMGDFSAAASYFSRMAPLYAQNRWNLVEITMLKMYAQCLQKLNRKDEYVRVILDLLAKSASHQMSSRSLKIRTPGAKCGGAWLDDDRLDTTGLLRDLINFSDELPPNYDVSAPMNRYFLDFHVEPYIQHCEDQDGFRLKLSFRHILEDDFTVDKAKVRLLSTTVGGSKDVWLESTEKFDVKQGIVSTWLHSNVTTLGGYVVDKIVLEAKKIHFVHEQPKKEETLPALGITVPSSGANAKVARKFRVLSYPRAEAFDAKLIVARTIYIDKIRSLELECRSHGNNVSKIEVHLKAASAGLRLRTGDATVVEGETTIANRPSPGVLELSHMAPNSISRIQIPYEMEIGLHELHIKLEIIYHTEKGKHEFRSTSAINVELPLDVNVHDQFMENLLLSSFKVSTSNHIPLDVLNIQLEGSPAFDVHPTRLSGSRNRVEPGYAPAFVYKIAKKDGASLANLADSNLSLVVDYRCLDEHVFEKLETNFSEALGKSPFAKMIRLLLPRLWDHLKQDMIPEDWHVASFANELRIPSYEDAGWLDTVESLPSSIRGALREWLGQWHKDNPTINVTPAEDRATAIASPISRRITITVAVPRVQILHTASLKLATRIKPPALSAPIAALGQPLSATLSIKHTRKWDDAVQLQRAAALADPTDPVDFVYELDADPNVWLLGGQRRAHFSAREDEIKTFLLTLVPLKEGYPRFLPSVVVRPIPPPPRPRDSTDSALDRPDITSEMDFMSAHGHVQVVPDWQSVTVGLGAFGADGGNEAVLLEAEEREEEKERKRTEMEKAEKRMEEAKEEAKEDANEEGNVAVAEKHEEEWKEQEPITGTEAPGSDAPEENASAVEEPAKGPMVEESVGGEKAGPDQAGAMEETAPEEVTAEEQQPTSDNIDDSGNSAQEGGGEGKKEQKDVED